MLCAGSTEVHSSGSLTQFTKKGEEPSSKQKIKMQCGKCGNGCHRTCGTDQEGFLEKAAGLVKDWMLNRKGRKTLGGGGKGTSESKNAPGRGSSVHSQEHGRIGE